jgi:hypothetical protein
MRIPLRVKTRYHVVPGARMTLAAAKFASGAVVAGSQFEV